MSRIVPASLCALAACWAGVFSNESLADDLFVTNLFQGSVSIYDESTGTLTPDFITGLSEPSKILIGPDKNIYIANQTSFSTTNDTSYTVSVYTPDGQPVNNGTIVDGIYGDLSAMFGAPAGLAFDADGKLYVPDNANNNIYVFDGTSTAPVETLTIDANGGAGLGGVAFDSSGTLYVSSFGSNEVYTYDGSTFSTLVTAGSGGLFSPAGLTVASDGTVYVAGLGSNAVLSYDSSGSPLGAFAIDPSTGFTVDMDDSFFPTNAPADVVFDPDGNLLVALLGSTNPSEFLDFPKGGLLRYNFDTQEYEVVAPQGTGAFSSLAFVPEPGTIFLLFVAGSGMLALSRLRRRRHSR